MAKKLLFVFLLSSLSSLLIAQTINFAQLRKPSIEHLGISGGVGSMGISLEASSNVADWLGFRVGMSLMPTTSTNMSFPVRLQDDDRRYDETGSPLPTKFEKMAGILEDMMGYRIKNAVVMDCKVNFINAKLMIDLYPFVNKEWHFTTGFYWGTRVIGNSCNTTEDMKTTLAVSMYNTLYDKAYNNEPIYSSAHLPFEIEQKILQYGRMGMHLGNYKNDVLYDETVINDYDEVEHAIGDVKYSAGDPYIMEPGEDGTVRAWAKVNSFKPYLGLGWTRDLKKYPGWTFGADAGIVFWGGVPNIYTHDGTSLTRDVYGLTGKVGGIISFVRWYPVYPLFEIKVTKRIF